MSERNLTELLEDISVHDPGMWENEDGPVDWYAVSTEEAGGVVAYFVHQVDAYRFRLDLINRKLNP